MGELPLCYFNSLKKKKAHHAVMLPVLEKCDNMQPSFYLDMPWL